MDRLDIKRRAFAQLARAKALGESENLAMSVFSLPGKTAEEISRIVNLPHGRIRVAKAGDLSDSGFSVVVDNDPPGHANVVLPVPPSDLVLKRLDRCFSHAISNPARGGSGL